MYYGTHNTTILASLNSDREDNDSYCDVTLQVDGRNFLAHRCILGKISPFFNKMFKSKMKEKYQSVANIQGVSSELMDTILNFIYTASVDICEENAFDLMKASDYFQMDELKSLCEKFLSESLNPTNCFDYLLAAQTFDCGLLNEEASKIAASHFKEIAEQEDFNQISKRSLLNILEAIDQKKINGKLMYEVVVAWVKHDYDDRKGNFVEFLKAINFFLLPASFLQDILSNEYLVKESHDCKDYFLDLLLKRVQFDDEARSSDSDKSSDSELIRLDERPESDDSNESNRSEEDEYEAEEVFEIHPPQPEMAEEEIVARSSNAVESEEVVHPIFGEPFHCGDRRRHMNPFVRGWHHPPRFRGRQHHHPCRGGRRHRRDPMHFTSKDSSGYFQ